MGQEFIDGASVDFWNDESPVAKYIQFACRILVKFLKCNSFAKIKLPSLKNWKSIGH